MTLFESDFLWFLWQFGIKIKVELIGDFISVALRLTWLKLKLILNLFTSKINELSDRVEWARFYPLYSVDNLDEYERRGIGTLAHTTTICKVARWAPSHFDVYHDPLYTSKKRKNHLQSMGLELEMPLPLYVERSRQKARMKGFSF